MKNRNLVTLLIGAGIGSAITWFFTSAKGKELRRKVKAEADELLKRTGKPSSSSNHQ